MGILKFDKAALLWIVKSGTTGRVTLVNLWSAVVKVTVARHPDTGAKVFFFNNQPALNMKLTRGQTYIFEVECPGHSFALQNEEGELYNEGTAITWL